MIGKHPIKTEKILLISARSNIYKTGCQGDTSRSWKNLQMMSWDLFETFFCDLSKVGKAVDVQ